MRIKTLTLNTGTVLSPAAFTVVVGTNAAGKTTLLREILRTAVRGAESNSLWVKNIVVEDSPQTDSKALLDSLDRLGFGSDAAHQSRALKRMPDDLGSSSDFRLDAHEVKTLHDAASCAISNPADFIGIPKYRAAFFTYLSCAHRLTAPERAEIVSASDPATDALNAFYRDPNQLKAISKYVYERFRRHVLLLDHKLTTLELVLADALLPESMESDKGRMHRAGDIEQWKETHARFPSQSGDGIRAILSLLISMYEPLHHVLLVDEPELFLYPAEKRAFARKLVEVAVNEHRQVFAVTHDANFLQGVITSGFDVAVLRLSSEKGIATARTFAIESAKPLQARYSEREFLNALFYSHLIVVEGASDRLFYQGALEFLGLLGTAVDVGFISGAGTGSSKAAVAWCQEMGIAAAVIFDFDVLLPDSVLLDVLSIRGATVDSASVRGIGEGILARATKSLGDKKARRELKKRGLNTAGLDESTQRAAVALLDELEAHGVFVIRAGDLESWEAGVEDKARFAEQALDAFRSDASRGEPTKRFLDRVLAWLSAR